MSETYPTETPAGGPIQKKGFQYRADCPPEGAAAVVPTTGSIDREAPPASSGDTFQYNAAPPTNSKPKSSAKAEKKAATENATTQALKELKQTREKRNYLIHELFVRQSYTDCLEVIEAQLRDTDGMCEYALYVKGLLKRLAGELTESLQLLQTAVLVSPENCLSRKQLGRALFLLGKHEAAIETFAEVETLLLTKGLSPDWEIPLGVGLCYLHLGRYGEAADALLRSISIQKHDVTFLRLAETLVEQKEFGQALEIYNQLGNTALTANAEALSLQGRLYLRLGDGANAFHCLGQCLTLDPVNPRALIAAGSLIQDNGEFDVALRKYRIAVAHDPDSPQLWNNIGVCFFGKKNYYAAVACLRKSLLLGPFEWITNFNMGLVFLSTERHVSAFHHFSASISLHNQYAPSYMLLGVSLSLLNDLENACHAYERALRLSDDHLFHLNYAVTLYNSGCVQEAAQQFKLFDVAWDSLTPEERRRESAEIPRVKRHMAAVLAAASAPSASVLIPEKRPAERDSVTPPGEQTTAEESERGSVVESDDSSRLPATTITRARTVALKKERKKKSKKKKGKVKKKVRRK
ncbi:Bardet-Biedl syndrome 4 protein like protein (BBS4-like protein 4) [Angomonas deanei]|nr:Bardet-Biedl syndrome 4 protein like protein (BBS4-like protein 4) [Angomonas deanei]|eukprot:EPY35947.1 Bardet-Biedl syndrome 4 protein like protein (BBS4-like protein 4) [Angomonas deanei]